MYDRYVTWLVKTFVPNSPDWLWMVSLLTVCAVHHAAILLVAWAILKALACVGVPSAVVVSIGLVVWASSIVWDKVQKHRLAGQR